MWSESKVGRKKKIASRKEKGRNLSKRKQVKEKGKERERMEDEQEGKELRQSVLKYSCMLGRTEMSRIWS